LRAAGKPRVNSPGPDRAVVFQNHSLLPWLNGVRKRQAGVDEGFCQVQEPRRAGDAWVMHNLIWCKWRTPRQAAVEILRGMKQHASASRVRWRWSREVCSSTILARSVLAPRIINVCGSQTRQAQ